MAFKIHTKDTGYMPAPVLLPSTAGEAYTLGELLKMASGAATKASGTDVPVYIAGESYDAPASGNRNILATRIQKDIIYETTIGASSTGVNVGDKVTLGTGGLDLTATTTSGVAELVYKESDASGAVARCRF